MMHAQIEEDEITVKDNDGKEEIIDLPESMSYELDSLLNLYYSKTYLQPDENCNYRDENRTYSKEIYMDRLRRLPNIMEMPYNDIVQKFIDRYTGRLRHLMKLIRNLRLIFQYLKKPLKPMGYLLNLNIFL